MPTRFTASMHFDVPPDAAFAAQTDPEYVTWKHGIMHSYDISSSVRTEGEVTIATSSRKLPAQVPAMARPFVGDAIKVHEEHAWQPVGADGVRHGALTATFGPAPLGVDGTLRLSPDGDGSRLDVDISARANVPLVGGKIESFVGDNFVNALHFEEEIAPRWYAGERAG